MSEFNPKQSQAAFGELRKLAASRQRMAIPQTRSGRRSMTVTTMLRKDKEGTLFRHWHDHLPGGLADKKKPQDFDSKSLAQGQVVESEHTSQPALATEIAMDHLTEDPKYYTKLNRMEKEGGLGDFLKTPIPGTRDWVLNTSKNTLQGARAITGRAPIRPSLSPVAANSVAPRSMVPAAKSMKPPARSVAQSARVSGTMPAARGGVSSISEDEMRRMGFSDLLKSGSVMAELRQKLAYTLQGHMNVQGIPISIENRKGSVRKGVDPDGKPWRTVFKLPYGYITGTEGNDHEEIDAYVGPHKKAPNAFVIHQRHITGKGFDEDKVMLGFEDIDEAKKFYLDHYNGVGKKLLGPISTIAVDELRRRLEEKRKHTKIAAVDIMNSSLYTDSVGAKPPKKPGELPDMEGSDAPTSKLAKPELSALSDPTAIKLWKSFDQGAPGKKKLAWDGVGSTGSPLTNSTMARIDSDEKPDRAHKGDVPSRDGTSPGSALTVKHEAGPDFMTTLPTAAATENAGSQTGATTRM